ncbi:MAG: hypothetical protein MUE74_01820 [Bacteroidales bacterium]|nr:hypothetical protein [Bacteroidales bacterium]
MKAKSLKYAVSFVVFFIVSCDEPETVVTNIVHPDGSITRKIEMRNIQDNFEIRDVQVPYDSTWTVRDSIATDGGEDTLWFRMAEKTFRTAEELNQTYISDSSGNREARRRTEFKKSFKWFNTGYRFAEILERRLEHGYPLSEYLDSEELKWFFTPDNISDELKNGPDSLKYRAMDDTIQKKTDKWIMRCLASEWSAEFVRLTEGKAGPELSQESLKSRENELISLIERSGRDLDSLWNNGIIQNEFLGMEYGQKFRTEADSAAGTVAEKLFFNFDDYSLRIIMPGELTGSNGFADSAGVMQWRVRSDFFITEPYVMWAESKTPNKWAWIVTGIFVLFVLTGIMFRSLRR